MKVTGLGRRTAALDGLLPVMKAATSTPAIGTVHTVASNTITNGTKDTAVTMGTSTNTKIMVTIMTTTDTGTSQDT